MLELVGCGWASRCNALTLSSVQFVSKYVVTIGTDYGVKPVKMDGVTLKLNFWDLSGDAAYVDVRNEFYKDAQAVSEHASVSMRTINTQPSTPTACVGVRPKPP